MFRTVPLSIIRSFSLYTQQWYMSYSLRAGSGRNCILLKYGTDKWIVKAWPTTYKISSPWQLDSPHEMFMLQELAKLYNEMIFLVQTSTCYIYFGIIRFY